MPAKSGHLSVNWDCSVAKDMTPALGATARTAE